MSLREYQRQAVDACLLSFKKGVERQAVVLPTGAGKTHILVTLISEFLATYGGSALVLVNRRELVTQTVKKLGAVVPHLSVGVVQGAKNEVGYDVTVASVATVQRQERLDQLQDMSLIITDEAHRAYSPSYRRVYDHFGVGTRGVLHVGLTATLYRHNPREGLADVFDDIVYERDIEYMVRNGYLASYVGHQVTFDVAKGALTIDAKTGDYDLAQMAQCLRASNVLHKLPEIYRDKCGREPAIAYLPDVATCDEAADILNKAGISAAVVTGDTPAKVRDRIYRDSRRGLTKVIVNCAVLTEGFDAPWLVGCLIVRSTTSPALYVQMVGRVLRLNQGKAAAVVVDVMPNDHPVATIAQLFSSCTSDRVVEADGIEFEGLDDDDPWGDDDYTDNSGNDVDNEELAGKLVTNYFEKYRCTYTFEIVEVEVGE